MGLRGWSRWLVVGLVGWATSVGALCVCGDLPSGCGSALSCSGKNPGDACSPPRNATCKIREGLGTQAVCCCGCSRGPGPVSCVYMPVTDQMPALLASASICEDATVQKLADKAVPKAHRALMKADEACADEKNAVPQANRAQRGLSKLKNKIQKLEDRGKIQPGCAATYGALLDEFTQAIDDVETKGDPGAFGSVTTTTTSTTVTTLLTKNCTGAFTPYIPDANEVDFSFSCTGDTNKMTAFIIRSPGRDVTNFLEPVGFSCQIVTDGGDDVIECAPQSGTFDGASSRTGRLRYTPAPVSGMGGSLSVERGPTTFGPFPLEGP